MATWNDAYNLTPAGSDSPGDGDDRIRELKTEVDGRVNQEHVFHDTATTGATVHRAGSAVSYCQAAAPTLRPDGVTALDTNDKGRIWVDTDTGYSYYWDGNSWETLTVAVTDGDITGHANQIVDQGGGNDLLFKVIEIGDWNMDTTAGVNKAHGLTMGNIRFVSVTIRSDAGYPFPLDYAEDKSAGHTHDAGTLTHSSGGTISGATASTTVSCSLVAGTWNQSSTEVCLYRTTGGYFDSATFNSTSYNRGWITIGYTA